METLSILIVDDVMESRSLLRRVLKRIDCTQIKGVSDGDLAVAEYKSRRADIVFLDIDMPGKDGLVTLQEILAYDPKAHVVMVSASSTFENIKKVLDLGVKGFIVKPYSESKVREAILRVNV